MKSIKNFFAFTIVMILFFMLVTSLVLANPISEVSRPKAKADLKASLLETYGNSYSTVEMLLEAGMEAYDTLAALPSNSVNNGILKRLKKTYYPHFSTILLLYEADKKSYDNLNRE